MIQVPLWRLFGNRDWTGFHRLLPQEENSAAVALLGLDHGGIIPRTEFTIGDFVRQENSKIN